MFLIWGSKGFVKELGLTNLTCECGNCHNDVTYEARKVGRKFTFFWIPLFTTRRKYYIVCPICERGKQVTKKELEENYFD